MYVFNSVCTHLPIYLKTYEIILILLNNNCRVFQRSYHDHIVRGEKDYKAIWEYIEHNPAQWDKDCFYKK